MSTYRFGERKLLLLTGLDLYDEQLQNLKLCRRLKIIKLMNAKFMKKLAVARNQSAQYAPLNVRRKDSSIDVCSACSNSDFDDLLLPL